jgi:hypothetical protein
MRRSSRDIMSLQGIESVGYNNSSPDQITLRFATSGFARLADLILRDVVEGARLVITSEVDTPPQDDWWSRSFNQVMASVRAMPGVVDARNWVEHGLKEVQFVTTDAEATARLKPLINEDIIGWRVTWWSPKPTTPKPPTR